MVRDKDGQVIYVRYDAVNVMLLNEFLKEHKKVEEQQTNITQLKSKMAKQEAIIAQQQKGMEVLTAQLKEQAAQIQKVSAQLELRRPAAQTVLNGKQSCESQRSSPPADLKPTASMAVGFNVKR